MGRVSLSLDSDAKNASTPGTRLVQYTSSTRRRGLVYEACPQLRDEKGRWSYMYDAHTTTSRIWK